MPWKLEIHHIGLLTAGDSTLIIACETEEDANKEPVLKNIKSALIDGGFSDSGPIVHKYLVETLPHGAKLDIIINTHYDRDHLGGISYLLEKSSLCKGTIVYDLGITGHVKSFTQKFKEKNVTENYFKSQITFPNNDIKIYFKSIGNDRIHPTKMVCSDQYIDIGKDPDNLMTKAGFLPAYQLVYQEILWASPTEPKGVYPGVLRSIETESFPAVPAPILKSNPPEGNPPTIKCIAANGYIANYNKKGEEGAPKSEMAGLNQQADANGKSLAFLVNFGDFTYYIGGDLTSDIEDPLIGYLIKRRGKTFYMKASHHGSQHSTSEGFLKKLAPEAVFISNGLENQHRHPSAETIKRLARCKSVQTVFVTCPLPEYLKPKGAPPVLSDEDTKKIEPSPKAPVFIRDEDAPLINRQYSVNVIVTVDAAGRAETGYSIASEIKPAANTPVASASSRPTGLDSQSNRSQPRAEAAIRGAKA